MRADPHRRSRRGHRARACRPSACARPCSQVEDAARARGGAQATAAVEDERSGRRARGARRGRPRSSRIAAPRVALVRSRSCRNAVLAEIDAARRLHRDEQRAVARESSRPQMKLLLIAAARARPARAPGRAGRTPKRSRSGRAGLAPRACRVAESASAAPGRAGPSSRFSQSGIVRRAAPRCAVLRDRARAAAGPASAAPAAMRAPPNADLPAVEARAARERPDQLALAVALARRAMPTISPSRSASATSLRAPCPSVARTADAARLQREPRLATAARARHGRARRIAPADPDPARPAGRDRTPSRSASPTTRPRRSTVTRSAIASTSRSLWRDEDDRAPLGAEAAQDREERLHLGRGEDRGRLVAG